MNIKDIKTADDFRIFMEAIWEMRTDLAPDGGVFLGQHRDYRHYHNAIKTARIAGFSRTGGTILNGQTAHVFRPPNGGQGVIITADGAGLALSNYAFGPKTRRQAE